MKRTPRPASEDIAEGVDPLTASLSLGRVPLARAVAALREVHERNQARRRREERDAMPRALSAYDAARRRFYERAERERATRDLATTVAQELLPPPPGPDDEIGSALREVQELVLRHPIAMRAAVSALVAEGRRFAETAEGAALRAQLEHSELVRRARLVWQMASHSILSELEPGDAAAGGLPTAWLDGLFSAAAGDPDRVLDRLFGVDDDEETGR